jgi:hypothetical protein
VSSILKFLTLGTPQEDNREQNERPQFASIAVEPLMSDSKKVCILIMRRELFSREDAKTQSFLFPLSFFFAPLRLCENY